MIGRFFMGLLGLVLTLLVVRRIADEARRARARVRSDDRGDRRVPAPVSLKEDPQTGIYYPAD